MARFLKKQSPAEIRPFGKLGFVGTKKMDRPLIEVFDFSSEEVKHKTDVTVEELNKYKDSKTVSWINVCGLHETGFINQIGEIFKLHPIVIDKITNTGDRPSFEDFDEYIVLELKMLHLDKSDLTMHSEHILFALFKNVLITFQENEKDPFKPIRQRIQKLTNRVRMRNTDYLLFAMIRAIINQYANSLEFIGQKIENIEDEIFARHSNDLLHELNDYKMEINFTSKIIRPAREAILSLCKSDDDLISQEDSQHIIHNVQDTILLATDSCDNYRNMLHDQLNIYHTNVASRLNEMFRILTILSVIFVPLTFLAGIYGMNFDVMPELHWQYGYLVTLGVMLIVTAILLFYFKRKGWL